VEENLCAKEGLKHRNGSVIRCFRHSGISLAVTRKIAHRPEQTIFLESPGSVGVSGYLRCELIPSEVKQARTSHAPKDITQGPGAADHAVRFRLK
jgi:hypothetical protein